MVILSWHLGELSREMSDGNSRDGIVCGNLSEMGNLRRNVSGKKCLVSRQRLRSASRHQLIVPRHRRTKFGRRAFSVAGQTAWNSLPDYLSDPLAQRRHF